jgi:glycosyltransferase involved in cell wall biosynthesis
MTKADRLMKDVSVPDPASGQINEDARPSARRRVALFLPSLIGGGAERVALDLAGALADQGYEIEIVLAEACGDLIDEAHRFTVVDLKTDRMIQTIPALARYLRSAKPDALIAFMWPLTIYAVLARLLSGTRPRLMLTEHVTLSNAYAEQGPLHRLLLRLSLALVYPWADSRVAVSSGVADDTAQLSGLPRDRFEVVYNPISFERPHAAVDYAACPDWGPAGRLRILFVGSFKHQKNPLLLVRAFSLLVRQRDAQLVLLGQGPMLAEIQDLVRVEGLESRVTLPGFCADPSPWYRSADLFVLPSDYEGFGNVVVEALGHGLPVVSTDCPSGPAEILDHGRFGTLCPCGDAEALAAAMISTLDVPGNRESRIRRASDFTPTIAAARYLDLLFNNARG